MDILNFISWIKGKRQVTTVDPARTLLPVALKDGRRDDDYLVGAMTVEDFAAQIAPQPTYKVYTALLTQSGGDDPQNLNSGELTIGVTYLINTSPALEPPFTWDFTNVGAPNNDTGTSFIAIGTTPASWGNGTLQYNTGAPVATVLEDTIGNISFAYDGVGLYRIVNSQSFDQTKTAMFFGPEMYGYFKKAIYGPSYWGIVTYNDLNVQIDGAPGQLILNNTPIEIRVYN
jgi:hypothetical protein